MTSPFVQFFENVNFPFSYKGLSAHQIWFNLGQGKQSYGEGRIPPPQVGNVLDCPGEIGLTINGAQATNMTKQGENILKFNNFHKQLQVPFIIYADFEAITKKVQGCEQSEEMKKDKDRRSYTEAYQTHEDCGCGYKVVCCYDDKYSKPIQTY